MNPEKMTLKMQEALSSAQSTATRLGHPELRPAHVLSALLEQEGGLAKPIIEKMGGSPDGLKSALDQFLSRQPSVSGSTSLSGSNDLRVALTAAEDEQKSLKDDYLSVEHFLLGLFKKPGELAAVFKAQNLTHAAAREALTAVRGAQRVTDQDPEGKYQTLEKYGTDLTARARAGKIDPVIGRDDEIRRIMQVLSRRSKNNPVLIGEPGVGKTAIAEGLARRIVAGDVPDSLKGKRLISMDLGGMKALRRSSNSPRYLAPAIMPPRSMLMRRLPLRESGTSPATMRRARPSAMAVLPTPGSPMRTGLFLLRRLSTCMMRRISSSRPITGSIFPARARAVRSVPYFSRVWYFPSGS